MSHILFQCTDYLMTATFPLVSKLQTMKKILFFTVAMLCTCCSLTAQGVAVHSMDDYETVGSSMYVVSYKMTLTTDTVGKEAAKDYDVVILEIGKDLSKCYSQTLFQYDSMNTAAISNGREGAVRPIGRQMDADVVFHFAEHKMEVFQRMLPGTPVSYYEEQLPLIQWQLIGDSKVILDHLCYKAKCRFRGRCWTVWYAPDIPIYCGPWKLLGLTGLILEAKDDKDHFSFDCTKIEIKSQPMKILRKSICVNSSYKEVLEFMRTCYEDIYAYIRRVTPGIAVYSITKNNCGKEIVRKIDEQEKKKVFYNPLELE